MIILCFLLLDSIYYFATYGFHVFPVTSEVEVMETHTRAFCRFLYVVLGYFVDG